MIPDSGKAFLGSPTSFAKLFPIPLIVVPVLGPLEHNEILVNPTTVQRNLHTSRASRNFRNYWYYNPESFERFAALVAATWPSMELQRPEMDEEIVRMYCLEKRITRELYWAGFGFQIWCQLLAHVARAEPDSLIVIDEPEVYLHPDVQRQILLILEKVKVMSIIATHSTEIMSIADPGQIIPVDKTSRSGQRLRDLGQVQVVFDELGSVQNLLLSRLVRSGRILFFEGQDLKLFAAFAKSAGFPWTTPRRMSACCSVVDFKDGDESVISPGA